MNNPILIPDSDEELLKECKIDTFKSSGKGGQHVNKTESAIRLTHLQTGIVINCQDERSQLMNKKKCLIKLRKKLKEHNYVKPLRIPTKKPYSAKKNILNDKKKHSIKKQLRKKPDLND
tara:strand:+ start:771 stop:1127 length:357 start_codon:yes stop_codon:yes gene_type:complete